MVKIQCYHHLDTIQGKHDDCNLDNVAMPHDFHSCTLNLYIFQYASKIVDASNSDGHIGLDSTVLDGDEPEPKYGQIGLWLEALQILM